MTIHVNIGEAKTRFSELVAAALAGEEVIVQKAGIPKLRLVPIEEVDLQRRKEIARNRVAAIGKYRKAFEGYDGSLKALKADRVSLDEKAKRILASSS